MAMAYLSNRLKALLLVVMGAVKRALCCFRRRRRASDAGEPTPLTGIGIGDATTIEVGDQEWSTWDDPVSVVSERNNTMSVVQQQIEHYRQQATATQEVEPERDLFEDMAPRITAQPRILLRPTQPEPPQPTSRFGLAFDPVAPITSELESWEDEGGCGGGWDGSEGIDPDALLRENRRRERENRRLEQQNRRYQRQGAQQGLGARIS